MQDNSVLLERIQNGDKEAENRMVEENMGLVYSIAKRYFGREYDNEDLIQIGAIGLIKAVQKFDTNYQVKFSTYAVPMIIGEIKRFLRDDGAIKVSRTLKEAAIKGKRCREILSGQLNREPTIKEISDESGISVDILTEAFEAMTPVDSLYESVYDDGGKTVTRMDQIKSEDIQEQVIDKVLIENILSQLEGRERTVIVLRYLEGKTQTEIAKLIGVSQVQVSRIEKNTLAKIRKSLSV